MSNTEPVQEPSMEEILASIRKIISDDDSGEGEAQASGEAEAAAPVEAPDEAAEMAAEESAPADEPEPVEIEEPAVVEEPVAAPQAEEPAAMEAEEDPADDLDAAAMAEPAPVDEPAEEDVLELGEDLALDENTEATETAADMAMEQADPGTDVPVEASDMMDADDDIEFGNTDPIVESEPSDGAADPAPAPEKELLAVEQGTTIASAFGSLENLVLANEEKTLDGLVREMLKPMLKDWLDSNLAPLVDRMVRDEIERVSRGRR